MAYVAGKSGYVDIAGTNGFTARIYWTETYDSNAKKSKISIDKILIQSTTYGGTFYPGGPLSIDGTVVRKMSYSAPATHSVYLTAGTSWWEVSSIGSANAFPWASGEIEHDADGSKVITISLDILMWRSDIGPIQGITGSTTIALTDIPRASSATVPNFTMGTAGTVSITRANSAFTHKLSVKLGSSTYEIASGVGTSYKWTPDIATWAPRIPNATNADCTMIVDTYNGTTKTGTESYPFTLFVPTSVVPSVSSLEVTLVNENSVVDGWGIAVKGYTKFAWEAEAAGAHGSTIESYAFTAGVLKGTAASGTTGIVTAAGTITPSIKVTDSRGRTASKNAAAITVYDYAAPNISGAAAYRCDADGNADEAGTYVRITLTANISSVGGKNSAKLQYRYKPAGGSYTGWTEFTSGAILSGFDTGTSFEFELRTVDALGKTKSATISVPTESVWLNGKDGGKGAAFGKYAEEDDLFDVAWRTRLRGEVYMDKAFFTTENGEQEWRNPPMEEGEEYRTVERWRGKAVYTKLVNCGTGVAGEITTTPHGVTATQIIRYHGAMGNMPFPYIYGTNFTMGIAINATNIYVTLPAGSGVATVYVQIWYTKD